MITRPRPTWEQVGLLFCSLLKSHFFWVAGSAFSFSTLSVHRPSGFIGPFISARVRLSRQLHSSKPFRLMREPVEATSTGGWKGLYDITPDWHPILSKTEKIQNLYLAVGLSGHGFKLCPAFGMFMADLILRGRWDLVEPRVFSLARFRGGRLVRGKYEYGVLA